MYIFQDWNTNNNQYFWPNVVCQKLFYKEQSIVQLFKDADLNVELDNKNCSVGYTGPAYKFHCDRAVNSTCNSVVICNDNGCTCTSRYKRAETYLVIIIFMVMPVKIGVARVPKANNVIQYSEYAITDAEMRKTIFTHHLYVK
ncbi:uncharacterized protein LOC116844553 [Odontomachus brunneus]|uniref:uncharacterized protein LOC116844553 n=1 Tax=Odontomachus brunneus TaxID=486640 RepID=UPI0013F22E9E|nr:uncharacterized protein LOC116844553 [Odontomachus brunneus]